MEQVRQAVNIARGLIDQYRDVIKLLEKLSLRATNDAGAAAEYSVRRGEAERLYGAIWEHLETAAAATAHMERSRAAYDAIRSEPGLDVTSALVDRGARATQTLGGEHVIMGSGTLDENVVGIDAARRAINALMAVWPEVDWTPPPPTPDVDLRPSGLLGLLARLFGR
jgi:hypothetical protein